MEIFRRVTSKIDRNLYRLVKHAKQRINPPDKESKALFICGSQRSGTNMLSGVLDRSPLTRIYNEDHPLAFQKYRLKRYPVIRSLVEKAPCHWVVFKSIMDSQNIRSLLDEFPNSKCIWIYRDYRDVAESAEKKWVNAQRHIIRNIAIRDNDWDRWYTERLSIDRRQLIRSFYHEGMNETTAGALKWFLRNKLYFDMELSNIPDQVLLVSYNTLVTELKEQFDRIAKFLEIPIDKTCYDHVHYRSIQKPLDQPIEDGVKLICDQVMKDFKHILVKKI